LVQALLFDSMLSDSNVIILGAPASGKGTQCDLLVEKYGLLHVSTGDLLRARSRFLPELAEYMDRGALVPDEIITQVLRERLSEPDASGRGVLLDGYPRTRRQAEMLADMGNMRIDHVILLDVPDDVVIERVEGRRIDPVSGRIYHTSRLPADEAVRARLIQRTDDTRAKMKNRLADFHALIADIMDFYREELRIVKHAEILASGAKDVNPEQIFDAIRQQLEKGAYWGTRFETAISVKEYECGSSAVDLISLSRFFDHMRWRMLNNGCLKDTREPGVKCVLRAQSVQLSWPLSTASSVTVKCWMSHIGFTSAGLRFKLCETDNPGNELGGGTCELVYIDAEQATKTVKVPGRERLLQLVESSTSGVVRSPTKKQQGQEERELTRVDFRSYVLPDVEPPPADVWTTEALVTPADVDGSGSLQASSIMRRALDLMFEATLAGAPGLEGLGRMPVRRMAVEVLQTVFPGTRVLVLLWVPRRGLGSTHLRMVRVCFHILLKAKSGEAGPQVDAGSLLVGRVEAELEVSVEPSRL